MHDWQSFESAYPLLGRSLRMAKNAGRLGHSHLVVSSNASIRARFPILLAQLAVCMEPLPDGTPCGHCETCSLLENGLYPDLFLLAPTSKSRQIVIGDDDSEPDTLRNFESMFHLSSSSPGGWKIGIIQECDTMNENADRARAAITEAIELLKLAKENKPLSTLPLLFTEYKSDELVGIYKGKGTSTERQTVAEILSNINPSKNSEWNQFK